MRSMLEQQHTRMICYTYYKCHWNSEKPIPSLEDFWPLDSDEEMSEDFIKSEADRYKKMMADAAEMYKNFK